MRYAVTLIFEFLSTVQSWVLPLDPVPDSNLDFKLSHRPYGGLNRYLYYVAFTILRMPDFGTGTNTQGWH